MTTQIPAATFHIRVRNEALGSDNPFEWQSVTTDELFANQRIVLFAVPGAFTPACSDTHLPGYEDRADEFTKLGIDKVICLSVNDAFVMRNWALSRNIEKVMMLPDGNGEFTRKMGMLVERTTQGLGLRSWRYSLYAENGEIRKLCVEPGFKDNPSGVPVQISDAETMLKYLRTI